MKAISTGMSVAAFRAMGMLYPKENRLFRDTYSEELLSPPYKLLISFMSSPKRFDRVIKLIEKKFPGMLGWLFYRFRYIDDILKGSIAEDGIGSVVNLGAGYDCRAHYIKGMKNRCYFEVDHPSVIKKKEAKMKKILRNTPNNVVYVPVDFEKQSLDAELKEAGYNLDSKTLFIWEGVTQYISEEANEKTMEYLAQAAPGSNIIFSYILKGFIEGTDIPEGMEGTYERFCKGKNPLWIHGLDPNGIGDYLSKHSLSLVEDIGSDELKERYAELVNLNLKVQEIERIAIAEVKSLV